jgi:hypothetical protein
MVIFHGYVSHNQMVTISHHSRDDPPSSKPSTGVVKKPGSLSEEKSTRIPSHDVFLYLKMAMDSKSILS